MTGNFAVTAIHTANGIDENTVIAYAALAESDSSHPIARSIREYAKNISETETLAELTEISGRGILAVTKKGEKILVGSERLMQSEGITYIPSADLGTVIYVAVDNVYLGSIVIADAIKENAKDAITSLKAVGIHRTVMLTGDSRLVGSTVARTLGIDEVHAELLPADKVAHTEALLEAKSKHKTLAFVGDGINDAPVLSRADIGISMGAIGSDAAIEASDIVLMDDDPQKIATAIRIAKRTLSIVYQNIVFALGIKGLVLILGALGIANMWAAVFADVGVSVIAILNAMRVLNIKQYQ